MSNQTNGYVRIFDTTLRDGEQSPGRDDDVGREARGRARARAARGRRHRGGLPRRVAGRSRGRAAIAEQIGRSRRRGAALERAADHLRPRARQPRRHRSGLGGGPPAARPRIHIFLATSDLHMKHKLRMTRPRCSRASARWSAYAKSLCADVEFSPEDAGRSDPEFLYEVLAPPSAPGRRR
jgi:2-isopropylmalate synthase